MKDVGYWPYMSTLTIDGNYLKKFGQTVQKQRREGKGEEEKKLEWQLQNFLRYVPT